MHDYGGNTKDGGRVEYDFAYKFTPIKPIKCDNCGFKPLIGFEGEASLGARVEYKIGAGIDINLFSVILADFKANNQEVSTYIFNWDEYKVKQSLDTPIISIQRTFDVVNGRDVKHQYEFRLGFTIAGITATLNNKRSLSNLFIGFDPSLSVVAAFGGELKYKFGLNYKTGE